MDELDEIFEIRLINEKLACRWAIERLDDAGLRALEISRYFVISSLLSNFFSSCLAFI
jgi:hypothetical protein